jgi:hypothetical protein
MQEPDEESVCICFFGVRRLIAAFFRRAMFIEQIRLIHTKSDNELSHPKMQEPDESG